VTAIALGFRVKSGYAVAVAVRGPASAPTLVARCIVELCDPAVAQTRQPYHAALHAHEQDPHALGERIAIVKRCANQSIAALLNADVFADAGCGGAAIVVGSLIDPATVANPHIRAHASEGALFRDVLRDALRARGLRCDVFTEKQLAASAAAGLQRREAVIKRVVAQFGKAAGTPWRAEEKAASTAAWMMLPASRLDSATSRRES
jgi:hypothetical protein